MVFTDKTTTADKVTVYGANVEGSVSIGDEDDKLSELIPANSHITEVVVDGKVILVVSEGAAPAGQATVAGHDGQAVKWTGAAETINEDITLKELEINETSAQVLTIATGKTMTIGRVILGENAQIIVEAGAKLIVTGEQGIVAPKASNLVLKVSEDAQAIFAFNPDVKSNRNPNATVEFTTKAYRKSDGSYVWQRIGVPAVNGMKVNQIVKQNSSYSYYLYRWDAPTQDWAQITDANYLLQPFQGYSFTNTATAKGQKYNFPCQLLGNSDATLPLIGEWSSFANSYMADVDLYQLLEEFVNNGDQVGGQIEIYDVETDWWKTVTYGQLKFNISPAATELYPIQAFILHNNAPANNTAATVDYKNAVWSTNTKNNVAARQKTYIDITSATVTITAENGQTDAISLIQANEFSEEFENGYDAFKNVNVNPINIFANTEMGKMASVASNTIEGTSLSIQSKNETNFKMSFSNINGEKYAIRDNLTGATITMVEGAEYFFSANKGDNANRFQIIGINNAPTAIENVATEGAKAVYTVLGQYMGTTDNRQLEHPAQRYLRG